MFIKGLIFSLFFVEVVLSATSVCTSQTPCRCDSGPGNVIDLSSVGLPDKPRFYEILYPPNSTIVGLYSYNPCYAFDSSDKIATLKPGNGPCKNAAACLRIPGKGDGELPEEHALGIQSTAKFLSSQDTEIHISYTVPGSKQTLRVVLKCDQDSNYNLTIEEGETPDITDVVMTLRTKCACHPNTCPALTPEEPSHGLSTGSKLLIAFFTILAAYFLVGIVWNFCNGAHGVELVPNLDFWNELPKLIIEGVIFTCSCFGRKSSYGEM
ncbi:uncharacterized protein NPIL_135891 [Nephila pilipes]|uniref:Autophagy-related protein 27 n=1 Tax=Nephila pilipes TaxID=299642 RepID=A0A8X6Q9X1_NEPPI|nr:uncharacterized protein NPIL_135891 [Nephila pilipes]